MAGCYCTSSEPFLMLCDRCETRGFKLMPLATMTLEGRLREKFGKLAFVACM